MTSASGLRTSAPDRECLLALPAMDRRRSVILYFAVIGSIWVVNFAVGEPVVTLIAGGLLMILIHLRLGIDELGKAPLRLNPLSFYLFWYMMVVGVSAIYAGYLISCGETISLGPFKLDPKDIASGYLIFLAGSGAFYAGMQYYRPVHWCEQTELRIKSSADFPILLGAMYVIGLTGLLIPSLLNPLGSALSPLVAYAPITAVSCFALGARESTLTRPGFGLLLLIGTAGLVAGSLNSGAKSELMLSFFPALWFILVYHQRWLPLAAVGGMLIYSVVFQVVTISRMNSRYYADPQSVTQRTELANQIVDAFRQWLQGARVAQEDSSSEGSDDSETHKFLMREFQPSAVAFIAHEVREGGLFMGTTLDYVGYALVPRILWPDKPRVIRGGWFTFMLGMADSPDSATTNTAQYAAGELYWNFGLPGVLVGMALLGALVGRLWQMAGNDPHRDPLRMMLYILLMLNLQEMSEAGSMLVGIIAQYLVFGTALRIQAMVVERNADERVSSGESRFEAIVS
jgi:hypothetical protein